MKRVNKRRCLFFAGAFCMLMAASCGKKEMQEPSPVVEKPTQESEKTNMPEETADVSEDKKIERETETPKVSAEAENTIQPAVTTIPIYSINDETLEKEDTVAELPEGQEADAEFIVNEVVKSFASHGVEIGIDTITEKEDGICVSFKKDKAPVAVVGSSVEVAILDSISQSLLDNLDICEKVYFKVENEPYASGHIELGENEPYNWK